MKSVRMMGACALLCVVGALQGCGVEVAAGSGESTGSETQAVSLFGLRYDPPACTYAPSQCNGMHCCGAGEAITGIHLNENSFQCRSVRVGDSGCVDTLMVNRFRIAGITVKGCPDNSYMKGFHAHDGRATCCQYDAMNKPTTRFVNGDDEPVNNVNVPYLKDPSPFAGTCQTAAMHVCPTGSVLEGIDAARNWFICAK